ncbi:MAG: ParB/RepB/Spo0J family partition protein [Campylobacterales bacterium]|nr:ParB/RepB/Spo0J family partition protein [Campylobacterales bacterium]
MALGRNLGAILEEVGEAYSRDQSFVESLSLDKTQDVVEDIDVTLIAPNPYQPRKHFDDEALNDLANSIKEHGLLQPIVVISKGDGYLLVAGERRLRAHKIAGLEKIRAIIASVDIDDIRLRELALVENIQRENLNAIELAKSYAELIEVHNITHDELSNIVHKSRSQITNTLRLLNLIEDVQEAIITEKLSQGHAKILVSLEEGMQKLALNTIMGQKLSVRQAEVMVQKLKDNGKKKEPTKKSDKFEIDQSSKELIVLSEFNYKVKKNKIEIAFESEKEFQKFIQMLKK